MDFVQTHPSHHGSTKSTLLNASHLRHSPLLATAYATTYVIYHHLCQRAYTLYLVLASSTVSNTQGQPIESPKPLRGSRMMSGESTTSNTIHHLMMIHMTPSTSLSSTSQLNGKPQSAPTTLLKLPSISLNPRSLRLEGSTTRTTHPIYYQHNSNSPTNTNQTMMLLLLKPTRI